MCITPIAGIVRFADGPEMLSIGPVRFVSWGSLSTNWAELGFIENPQAQASEGWFEDMDVMDVVAVSPSTLPPREAVDHAISSVTHALKLLLACNCSWGPGGTPKRPLVGMTTTHRTGFVYSQDTGDSRWSVSGRSTGPIQEIKFDGFWNGNQKAGFYNELNLLNSPTTRAPLTWINRLLNVTATLGHARLATTEWEAFLFSMIGIERLLKSSRKTWSESVPPRLQDAFAWLRSKPGYEEKVQGLYTLRNAVAHEGRVNDVSRRDVEIADEILFNLLLLAYKHLDEAKDIAQLVSRGKKQGMQKGKRPKNPALPNAIAVLSG